MVQLRRAGAFLLTRTSVRPLPVTRQCPLDQEAAAMADFARFRMKGAVQRSVLMVTVLGAAALLLTGTTSAQAQRSSPRV